MATYADVGAGPMRESFAFDCREGVEDQYGNVVGEFVEQFRCAACADALKGTESVMASRLTGVQPYVVTIRYSTQAAQVTPAWRARDTRAGIAYAIKTVVPRPRKDYVDMTCVVGGAA